MRIRNQPLFTLLFLGLLILSCSKNKDNAPRIFGDFDQIAKELAIDSSQVLNITFPSAPTSDFFLSTYADTSWSIPLETNSESVLGAIDKMLIHRDTIYVLDIRKSKQIFAFGLNGKFLFKVGTVGLGAGQYINPLDFTINEKEEEITIYDDKKKILLSYRLDGTFLHEQKVPFLIFGIASLSTGDYLLNTFGRSHPQLHTPLYRMAVMSPSGELLKKGIAYQKEEEQLGFRSSRYEYSTFNDEIVFAPNFLGKVYAVNPSSVVLKYQFDFGEKSLPTDFYKMDVNAFISKYNTENSENRILFTGNLFETENIVLFDVQTGGDYSMAVFNKLTNEIKYGKLKDDLPSSLEVPMMYATYKNEYIIGWRDSYYFAEAKSKYGESKSKEVKDLLEKLTPVDNPVLSIYKMK